MNFKKRINGSWVDTPNYIHNTSTDTITTLPAVVYANGTTATVGLKGQTVQSSIPSPTSPVMPQGTGERTAQLIPYPFYSSDGEYAGVQFTTDNGRVIANGTLTSGLLYYLWRPAKFPAGTYTMSVKGKHSGATIYFRDTTHNVSVAPIYSAQEGDRSVTFTVTEEISAMVYINAGSGTLDFDCTIMLNTGEEALPFEPTNGYKIPILSASTTTPVYLGEVESTRRIKKLVFDGTENWLLNKRIASVGGKYFNLPIVTQERTEFGKMLCSHYPVANPYDRLTACCVMANYSRGIDIRVNNPSTESNIDNFKAYLAAQYAAGTPVTVWYVLANEETAVVNEPLMKIGDYADTLSNVSIPVTAGGDTLSVGTTVQPSEVTVNYKGWHPVSDVHEKSRNLFDYNAYFDSVFTPYNEFFNYSSIQLVPNTTYTLSTSIAEYGTNPRNTAFIVATTNQTPTTASGGISNISPITITTENDGILRLYKRILGNGILPTKDLFDAGDWLMLNTGSTALPYEPYWK